MLKIVVTGLELYDEVNNTFFNSLEKPFELQLEHSLISISKWESKYHKVFLSKETQKDDDELLYYIKCMTLTQNVPDEVYKSLTRKNIDDITHYIEDPMTATKIYEDESNKSKSKRKNILTNEYLYALMISYGIPFECEKWHINRLIILINLLSKLNQPAKKMKPQDIMARNRALNEARRKALNTKG